PLQARLAHPEVRLDGGQRDVHDQRVQIDHEEAEACGREGEALRPGHWALKSFSQERKSSGRPWGYRSDLFGRSLLRICADSRPLHTDQYLASISGSSRVS